MNKLIFNKFKINNRIYKNIKGLLFEFFKRRLISIIFFTNDALYMGRGI